MSTQRGVTLIELVVAMVVLGIILATVVYLAFPIRQAVDVSVRAELTDTADHALQRIARDVRLALPNSVRTSCGANCVEFIPVRAAGRYRGEASGGCDAGTDTGGSDELAFDVADTCFKSIGAVTNASAIVATDFLVLNNTGYTDQDAYPAGAANRTQISLATEQGGSPPLRVRINFASKTFQREKHDSPGRRFFVVTTPVAYDCSGGTLLRYSGYAYGSVHTSGTPVLLANNVSSCVFEYASAVTSQFGLLTIRLTLSKTVSSGQVESVTLYHSVHVSNVP